MSFHMQSLTRPPSREIDLDLSRRLSYEETVHIAEAYRRKSSDKHTQEDLRLRLGHSNVLELLLLNIAQHEAEAESRESSPASSPPSSPTQSSTPLQKKVHHPEIDEYGFAFDDEEEDEDVGGLTLTRTMSRRPSQ